MKNVLTLALVIYLIGPSFTQGNDSCIDIVTQNPETFVWEQHSIAPANCACTCSQWTWLDDSRCINCNHKHTSSTVIRNAKTDGTFISFMSPAQAADYQPMESGWVVSLKQTIQEKSRAASTSPSTPSGQE